MGLLSLGTPLDWHESKQHNEHVRNNGIEQLINIFKQHSSTRLNDPFLWGDEVEYMLVEIDDFEKSAKLCIDHDHIINDLNDESKPESYEKAMKANVCFHPEYGRYMVEATPLKPYCGDLLDDYIYVETNMIQRRKISESVLPSNVRPLTLTSFPRMGCENFTSPAAKPIGLASQSLFLPDEIINRHVRFPTLTANIRKRRGCKVAINLPIYPDLNTMLLDDSIPRNRGMFKSDNEPWLGAAKPGHVYMDSMGFGMGSSCLQITMQAGDIHEARYLYDALAPLTPIMLALSAGAPFFKGFLVNQDVRWNVISGAVDDRTFIERNENPYPGYDIFGGLDVTDAQKGHTQIFGGECDVDGDHIVNAFGDIGIKTVDGKPIQRIPKSRYESIDNYLGDQTYNGKKKAYFKEEFNDIYSPFNENVYKKLMKSGFFDSILARHFAHLFVRDPLVIFSERIDLDNDLNNDHFENIQSTNWQTLRFKPPALYPKDIAPADLCDKPGWRVEFRPMEIQLTDFENAAFSVFISLLSKAILKFKPDLYVPILKIDENMETAHKVDSVFRHKFWFKSFSLWGIKSSDFVGYDLSWFDRFVYKGNDELGSDSLYVDSNLGSSPRVNGFAKHPNSTYNESKYTIDEIVNGTEEFPGMIKLIIKVIAEDLIPKTSHHCENQELALKMLRLQSYLKLISLRASGSVPTMARWLRDRVISNPLYKKDSKISESLSYEVIKDCSHVTNLDFSKPELLSSYFGKDLKKFLQENNLSS